MALPTVTPRTTVSELAKQINAEIERLEGEISSLKATAEYLLANGKEGGQTVYGGTKAREDLQLESTSGSPKGKIILNDETEIDGFVYIDKESGGVGVGTDSPLNHIHIKGTTNVGIRIDNDTPQFWRLYASGNVFVFRNLGAGANSFTLNANAPNNSLVVESTGDIGLGKLPNSKLDIDLGTEDLEIVDAGSTGATEQDWIQVKVGGVTGYIRVFAAK